jgi:hypothetical protein
MADAPVRSAVGVTPRPATPVGKAAAAEEMELATTITWFDLNS